MKKRIILLSLLFVGMLYSCGGDDDVDCEDLGAVQITINSSADRVNQAVDVFNADPSDDNCEDLAGALRDFIETLESFQECANQTGQGQQFSSDLAQTRDSLSQLPC